MRAPKSEAGWFRIQLYNSRALARSLSFFLSLPGPSQALARSLARSLALAVSQAHFLMRFRV